MKRLPMSCDESSRGLQEGAHEQSKGYLRLRDVCPTTDRFTRLGFTLPQIAPSAVLRNEGMTSGDGKTRNVQNLERGNVVRRKFGPNSQIPVQNLVQNAQTVAQEEA